MQSIILQTINRQTIVYIVVVRAGGTDPVRFTLCEENIMANGGGKGHEPKTGTKQEPQSKPKSGEKKTEGTKGNGK